MSAPTARLMAGIPDTNAALYHRVRFSVGDPAAIIELNNGDQSSQSTFILRDIEVDRARRHARADQFASPGDFAPSDGLSGDRETATAQAVAEFLRRSGVQRAVADRSLPLIFAEMIDRAGIELVCDLDMGVIERRSKDAQEIEWLRDAQATTEDAMRMACELIARSTAGSDGVLLHEGSPLTAERVRAAIDQLLLERGYRNPSSIVAPGPQGADCHDLGSGPIGTGQPVIIDIFPRNRRTLYNGDCTRTVVHGDIPDEIQRIHHAVVTAKAAATAATRAGVTGEDVHRATAKSITDSGYHMGFAPNDADDSYTTMMHGTGHGIGLDVHESPLLDYKGPKLVRGDALTIEPGLYSKKLGGVRVEDMVIVTDDGCENLNHLPEHLDWR